MLNVLSIQKTNDFAVGDWLSKSKVLVVSCTIGNFERRKPGYSERVGMLRLGLLARGLKLPRGLIAHHTPAFCSFGSLPHEELRSDVKLLGKALGSVIR